MPLGDFKCANIVTEIQLCEMHNIRKLCNLQGFHILYISCMSYSKLGQSRSFQNVLSTALAKNHAKPAKGDTSHVTKMNIFCFSQLIMS